MIKALLRVTLAGAALSWLIERLLAARTGRRLPEAIHSVIVIDAPIERVWQTLTDIEGQPRWMDDLKSVRVLTRGRIGVGTRAEGEIRILGIGAIDPITITVFEPPRRFAIRHEGQFSGEGRIELEPGADGSTTVVRWDETIVPPYLPHLGTVLLAPILQRVFQQDLHNLRELVETELEDERARVATRPARS